MTERATREELLALLPLYAGGDLDHEQRLLVDEALASDATLREALEPFLQVDAMLQATLTGADELSHEAARALLPLQAGGDLAPEQAERVASALAVYPELRPELEPFERLDSMLEAAFAPAVAPAVLKVRVQCPFCHDALSTGAVVICAECTTPHHDACFGQNAGCSLLGCEGTRSVAADAAAQRVCDGCERQTPADAPYCAWCGLALPLADPAPRSARVREQAPLKVLEPSGRLRLLPNVGDAWRFAAAAALLLMSGISVGAMFGFQQRGFLETLAARAVPPTPAQVAEDLPSLLLELTRANQRFALEDMEGDTHHDYAADLAEVWHQLRLRHSRDELARDYPTLVRCLGSPWYEVALEASPIYPLERWHAVAGLRRSAGLPASQQDRIYFVNHEGGVIEVARGQLQVDRDTCELTLPGGESLRQAVQEATRNERSVLQVDLEPEAIRVTLGSEADLERVFGALPESLLEQLVREGWGLAFVSESGRRAFFGRDLLQARGSK